MFYNRQNELQTLENEYSNKGSAFTVVYGRRRVGKTALISEYIKNKPALFIYATEANFLIQLENLKSQLLKLLGKPYLKDIKLESFEQLFALIGEYHFNDKLIIVIDEYQNLCKIDKAFSSSLQRIWDRELKDKNIHLILSGSVISMMNSEVLDYTAPLYGRRTTNIHLKQLAFHYIKDFLPSLDNEMQMNVFASFGTVPKYLELYDEEQSFFDNIQKRILDKNAFLYSEGNFLLKQELGDISTYFSILETISKGETKIGSIASALQVPATYITRYLSKLIDLDILVKEVPVTETNPLKSKMGRYKFKDRFLNFWFYYVYKNYNHLEIGQTDIVLDEIKMNFNDRFVSFAFEDFVLEDVLYNPHKYIDFIPKKIGRWWNKNEEIDIVAMDDENICFIECKWQNRVNKERVFHQLIKKSKLVEHGLREQFLVVTKEEYTLELDIDEEGKE
ncbi:ATP-binding protein [bacterium]|nr:ATP-binding protein [bacterium]MBU1957330.1 ATP-binding protein [bacterium]